MKTKLLFTLLILWTISGFAQFGSQQVISTDAIYPTKIFSSENNQIDILKAESGVYILKIEDECGNSHTYKILKE